MGEVIEFPRPDPHGLDALEKLLRKQLESQGWAKPAIAVVIKEMREKYPVFFPDISVSVPYELPPSATDVQVTTIRDAIGEFRRQLAAMLKEQRTAQFHEWMLMLIQRENALSKASKDGA